MAFSEATDYHDSYVDEVTDFKPSHMNLPIDQLDYQVGVNVTAIASRLQVGDFLCINNEPLYMSNEPLTLSL